MRILLANPSFQPPGGGSAVAAWSLQALVPHHEVTTLSVDVVSVAESNRYYGTALAPGDFRSLLVPRRARALVRMFPTPGGLLELHLLARYLRQIAGRFDRVVGVFNEMDPGCPAVQYVHYPWRKWPRPQVELRWFHRIGLLDAYYAGCRALSMYSEDAMKRNLTLANSQWTADVIRDVHGLRAEVVYPPVPGPFRDQPWEDRQDGFVIVGRISVEKRIELAVQIVDLLRRRGFAVGLHVVGSVDRTDRRARRIAQLAARHPFVKVHKDLSRAELLRLLGSQRYALHAMKDEHFGIAVAEELQSGCIPFVHDSGGQVEIVDREPTLTWRNVDDAVEKIATVLSDPAQQMRLRQRLDGMRGAFTTERFMARLVELVEAAAPSGSQVA